MEVIRGHKTWNIFHRVFLVYLLVLVGTLCVSGDCDIDFHMESESLMLLEGGNTSVLCDAKCFAGDEELDVFWRDERGRRIEGIPNSVFSVSYNRGLMNRLVILGANSGTSGAYVCSVMRSGNLLQMRGVNVIVLGNTGTRYRFPTDTGPRRGDQTPREDLEHRPVRSVKSRLRKRDTDNPHFGQIFEDYKDYLDKLPSGPNLKNLNLDLEEKGKQQEPESLDDDSWSSDSFLNALAEKIRNNTGMVLEGGEKAELESALTSKNGLLEILGQNYERNAEGANDPILTDINQSVLNRDMNQIPTDEGSSWVDNGENGSWENWENIPDFGEREQTEEGWVPGPRNNYDAFLYDESRDSSPGFGEQTERDAEREHEMMEINHIRGKRNADNEFSTEGNTTPMDSQSTDISPSASDESLPQTDTSTETESSTTTSTFSSSAPTTTTTSPQPTATTTTAKLTTSTEKPIPTNPVTISTGKDEKKTIAGQTTSKSSDSSSSENNRNGVTNARQDENKDESASSSAGQSFSCPEEESNFGKYGVLALAISSAVSFLLLYAILMLVLMPKILDRCRESRDKSDQEAAMLKKKTPLGEDIAPLTLLSDDSPTPESPGEKDKDTPIDLDKSASSEGDKEDASKNESNSKETTAAVSTFLLRQSSQSKKEDGDAKKDASKPDESKETSDTKAPDSAPSAKDQSEQPATTDAASEKKPETSSSESQKTAPATQDQSKTTTEDAKQTDNARSSLTLMDSILPSLDQSASTAADKDQSQSNKDTGEKTVSDNKNQSESVSEKDKPKGDASADDLPPPPPADGDNAIDV